MRRRPRRTATLPELAGDVELERELRAQGLTLKGSEARAIAERLGREPTTVELHAFDAQWSEHCSYKSSRVHLARLPTEGPDVILGPGEDAGVVRLGEWNGETYGIVVAHESHNHPSQVVPFEGAATGIGGVVRDVLCMGARVIALADPLRFGPLEDPHSRYVAQGVVDGLAAYGNAIGVPTIAGDVFFHEGFKDNCLVNVVALGIVKESEIIHSRAPAGSEGWDIVLVGKATDRSGFGGAAFSSLVLDEKDAEANKSAVQVPDPFLKNVIMRASYRAFDVIRELGLTVGFKDLGAGGIMGCTAELAASGGYGARIELDRCPTSQNDLPPAVIAVGETQERLAWVVPPSFTPRLLQIYNEEFSLPEIARHAQAAVIGTITAAKEYVLTHRGDEVMRVPIDFLTAGIKYERDYVVEKKPTIELSEFYAKNRRRRPPASVKDSLVRVLSHRDVGSRRTIYERYDSVVRGATSIPCGYGDAGVLVPIPGAPLALALTVDGNPRFARIDAGMAAELAVYEAVRNVICVGARPVGLTDCLNFGNPENAREMGQLVASIEGLASAARAFGLPFVSGNVSLYNQSAEGNAIPPCAIVACLGVIDDVSKTVTPSLKKAGSSLYHVGLPQETYGGSVYAEVFDLRGGRLPRVDYETATAQHRFILAAMESGLVDAAHDVSEGGLIVTIAEMCLYARGRGDFGVLLGDPQMWKSDPELWDRAIDLDLFGESGGFVLEVGDIDRFEEMAVAHGIEALKVGETNDSGFIGLFNWHSPSVWEGVSLDEMHEAWTAPLRDFYQGIRS
jgi:phosphoribosylformylglycinamidine synthase